MRFAIIVLLAACGAGGNPGGGGDDDPGGDDGDGCSSPDTDGDGWSDEVEIAMETSAADSADNPGDQLVFVMPYKAEPRPAKQDIDDAAKLARADVAILLDTTGSMAGTAAQIQGELAEIVTGLSAEVEDIAFGAAGYGDFPVYDNGNSHYDVPFYLVHRVMTARTAAGLASINTSFRYRGIADGLGNWFSVMRGGDEPEQHWEGLRQAAKGIGIAYPDPFTPTTMRSIAAFNGATAYPAQPPMGEEIGTIGGLGFRRDATPIIIQITDTNAQPGGLTTTNPVSATRAVALQALRDIGARVVGVMAWFTVGHDDLTAMTIDTGGMVPPTAWGTTDRPTNCPIGKCCVVAEDEVFRPQPDPINGLCPLVFQADRYSMNLSKMIVQAVTAIARGAKFRIGTELRDDPADAVDARTFVDKVEALPEGACAGQAVADTNNDGVPDAFTAAVGGSKVCFRITPKPNTTIENGGAAVRYRATLQLTGDGVGSFASREVFFVVPSKACTPPVLL
jgi:hypothetical protein